MAQVVVTQNITVDGVVEALDGWFDAADDTADSGDVLDVIRGHMQAETGFVLGRQTFEDMRGFWPQQTDDTTGITAHLNEVPKYVVSTTMTDPGWANTTVLGEDPVGAVAALKDGPAGDVGVTGSIRLCHDLIRAGVPDEYRLFVYPVVLGRGRRLFPDGAGVSLELVESRGFRNGITLLTYRPRRG